jgi:ribosomal protein S18 acetylase RimI-like enzyme
MDFVTADKVDRAALLDAANDAFSDYAAPAPAMPRAAFDEMLQQRGFDPALSWLAIDGSEIAAYWLVGTEPEHRPGVSYGLSVGTRPEFRRQGLALRLWERVVPHLKKAGCTEQILEVIETNNRAVPLYEALGFTTRRRIECFKGPVPSVHPTPISLDFRNVDTDDAARTGAPFCEWEPTWQNSTKAVINLGSTVTATIAYMGDQPAAYGLFHKPHGQIVQLAVDPKWRGKGIGRGLLRHWGETHAKNTMVVLNIPDTDKASLGFFASFGWINHVNQFEMKADL